MQKASRDLLSDNGISGRFPGFHTALDHFNIEIPVIYQFYRLTGGTGLLRSGTVKNDLLAFSKSGQLRQKLRKR
jgi:hypothetical protein